MDRKTNERVLYESKEILENVLSIMRQHIHEICCHAFDGTDEYGRPQLGVIDSGECISEPCVEINAQLKAM